MMKKWMQVLMVAFLLTAGTGATLEPVEPIGDDIGELPTSCITCGESNNSITWGGGGGL